MDDQIQEPHPDGDWVCSPHRCRFRHHRGPAIAAAVKAALIKNVDEPGRAPFQFGGACTGDPCIINLPAVPANQRLVIKYVSFFIQATGPAYVQIAVGGNLAYLGGVSSGPNASLVSQQLTVFADGGSGPQVIVHGSSGTAVGNVVGYLVDLTI
jgi:hypothetical protein